MSSARSSATRPRFRNGADRIGVGDDPPVYRLACAVASHEPVGKRPWLPILYCDARAERERSRAASANRRGVRAPHARCPRARCHSGEETCRLLRASSFQAELGDCRFARNVPYLSRGLYNGLTTESRLRKGLASPTSAL